VPIQPFSTTLPHLINPRPYWILIEGFRRRRDKGRAPFTALSRDNTQKNDRVLRAAASTFAELIDPLREWMVRTVNFRAPWWIV
jgi:mannitol-1-phosphate/altronate dehydrogenase